MMRTPGSHLADAPGRRLILLDGLRGLAAIFVFLFHFGHIAGQSTPFDRGYLAVDFFFMLSGFVLVPVFETRQASLGGLAMLAARVMRFWPLVVVGALLGALVHVADPALPSLPNLLILHLLLAPSGDPRLPSFALNQPQWSLWCELLLNGLHLMVLRKLRTGTVLAVAAACWTIAAIGCAANGALDLGAGPTVFELGIFRATSAYALGIVLRRTGAGQASAAAFPWWSAPVLLGLLILVPTLLGLPARFADPVVALLFSAVIIIASSASLPPRLAGVFRWLGALSFPLYAIHYPLLAIPQIWFAQPGQAPDFAVRCLSGASALGLAWLLSAMPLAHGVTRPMRRASQLRQTV